MRMVAFADVNPLAVLSALRVLDEHPMQRTRHLRKYAENPDQQR
jgi:hypothetical protein